MMGILSYGIYYGAAHSVQQLAAEAARAAVGGLDNADRRNLAEATVRNAADSYPMIDGARLDITAVDTDTATQAFTITLSYDASQMPIFDFPYLPLPPKMIERSATVQRGGF